MNLSKLIYQCLRENFDKEKRKEAQNNIKKEHD